jgi:hypothetical protein
VFLPRVSTLCRYLPAYVLLLLPLEGRGLVYFPSKDAVLLALLDGVVEQAQTAAGDVLDHLAEDPQARWREAINAFYEAFRSH